MSEVVKFINKIIFSDKLINGKIGKKETTQYLTIEEVIRRYEELSSM